MNEDEWVKTKEIAKKLGISSGKVVTLIKQGEFTAFRLTREYRILWKSVLGYIERHKMASLYKGIYD